PPRPQVRRAPTAGAWSLPRPSLHHSRDSHAAPSIAAIAGYRALQNRWRGKMLQKELYVRRRASVNVADRVFNACPIPAADGARMARFGVWMAPPRRPAPFDSGAPHAISPPPQAGAAGDPGRTTRPAHH